LLSSPATEQRPAQCTARQIDVGDEACAAAAAFQPDLATVEGFELGPMTDADDCRRRKLVREQSHQLVLTLWIERRGRLVEHDDVRPTQQDSRKCEPLLFTSRQDLIARRLPDATSKFG